tara:strand:- start:5267 stop:5548 length:282 start_codon:yes stop_codon:yes gene_type:complete
VDEGCVHHPNAGCFVAACNGKFGTVCSQEYLFESLSDKRSRGGQHVGSTDMGVKAVHVTTGLTASFTARSQHRSRAIAMKMIECGLTYEREII